MRTKSARLGVPWLAGMVILMTISSDSGSNTLSGAKAGSTAGPVQEHRAPGYRNSQRGLVDPLEKARRATVYVGQARHKKKRASADYYESAEIELREQGSGFLYLYPVRNAAKTMKVTRRHPRQ